MFDSVPTNLPVEPPKPPATPAAVNAPTPSAGINVSGTKEPEDIFADIQEPGMAQRVPEISAAMPPSAPSRPLLKIGLAIGIPVAVLGLGLGGWFAYQKYFAPKGNLVLPQIEEQNAVLPVTSAPDQTQQTPNPFPKPDEDQMAAAQATISMMQGQASQAQAQAEMLAAQASGTSENLPQGMLSPTGTAEQAGPTAGTAEPETLPATNPAIPLPDQIVNQDLPKGTDTDGDGLTNAEELALGTDISKKDTDGDGFEDGSELGSGYDPLSKGNKIGQSTGIKEETIGDLTIFVPKTWERQAGMGGTVVVKTGTPSTFSLSMSTFANGGTLMDWVVAQNLGTMVTDYETSKSADGFEVVYSKNGLTAWMLQGNTVTMFRYATNGAAAKDFESLFDLAVKRAHVK